MFACEAQLDFSELFNDMRYDERWLAAWCRPDFSISPAGSILESFEGGNSDCDRPESDIELQLHQWASMDAMTA